MKTIWTTLMAGVAMASLHAVPAQAEEADMGAVGDDAAVLAMPNDADEAPATQAEMATVKGEIEKVDKKNHTFTLETAGDKMVTITCAKDTQYMLDGKKAKMADVVKEDMMVEVEHTDGKASKVMAMSGADDDAMDDDGDDGMEAEIEIGADADM